jgi:hypothetical protein
MRFVSQQTLRPGCEGVHPIDRSIALKVHLDGAGETVGRSGTFGQTLRAPAGTKRAPEAKRAPAVAPNSLKTTALSWRNWQTHQLEGLGDLGSECHSRLEMVLILRTYTPVPGVHEVSTSTLQRPPAQFGQFRVSLEMGSASTIFAAPLPCVDCGKMGRMEV